MWIFHCLIMVKNIFLKLKKKKSLDLVSRIQYYTRVECTATFHGSVCIKLGNGWMDGCVSDNFFSVSTIFQLDLRTVLTVWYILLWISELCRHSNSVVYFVFHFIADKNCADTQTVWYILFFILLLTRTVLTLGWGIFVFHFIADKNCADTQTHCLSVSTVLVSNKMKNKIYHTV
jgi:hypothetical protein